MSLRDVVAAREAGVVGLGLELMEGLNVSRHDKDAACEDKHQGYDAESADGVQAKEYVCRV